MKTTRIHAFALLIALLSTSGCARFLAGSDVDAGRKAFLIGNNEAALGYFQSAAQLDPNYVYGGALPQNVWSYLGRSEYAVGRFPQARQTLEKALAVNGDQDMARLYLGLTLVRSCDPQQGVKEIEGGMRGIYNWLEYITQAQRYSYGQYLGYETRNPLSYPGKSRDDRR